MIELLLTYKYLILIPLSIIEGPIVTVIAGFLVTLKFFNLFLIYIIMVAGDVVGDGIAYSFGYFGKRFLHYFKITDEKLEKAKKYFNLYFFFFFFFFYFLFFFFLFFFFGFVYVKKKNF